GIEKARMHFHEIDGTEIRNCRPRASPVFFYFNIRKAKAAVDDRDLALHGLGKKRERTNIERGRRGENKSHRFQHQTVRNKRAENAGVMRPEYAAHGRK